MKRISIRSVLAACFLALCLSFPAVAAQPVEELKGKQVRDEQGEKLGTVEEVIIGPDGQIETLVVEKGGFLGFGAEENRIPWNAVKTGADANELVYMPGAETEQAQTSVQQGETGEQVAGQQQGLQPGAAKIDAAQAEGLLGRNLVDREGEKLGTVKDAHLSQDGNSVEYLIVKGEENKMHPVPVELVEVDDARQEVTTRIDRQTFDSSPSFSENEQPQLGQQQWSQEITSHYGISPAWQEGQDAPSQRMEMEQQPGTQGMEQQQMETPEQKPQQ
ncbi:MAG: hypothetical protein VR65_09100 [Desulfobulbaceae bacterium BRH_c16a]|nr:MAG: hypothetical protein VR65_09100 [Desulfobulbaceae bacterium BRH_c16a]